MHTSKCGQPHPSAGTVGLRGDCGSQTRPDGYPGTRWLKGDPG